MTDKSTRTSDCCSLIRIDLKHPRGRRRYRKSHNTERAATGVVVASVLSPMIYCYSYYLILSLILLLLLSSYSSSFSNGMKGGVVRGYLQRTLPPIVGNQNHRGLLIGQDRIAFLPNHYQHHHQQQLSYHWKERTDRTGEKLYSSGSNGDGDSSITSQSSKNVISSPKSTTIKKVVALLKKRKKRTEYQQTIVEGPRIIFDLLENPKTFHLVRQILISSGDGDGDHDQHKNKHEDEYHEFDNDGSNNNRNTYEPRLRTIISKMATTFVNNDTSPPLPQIQFVTPDVFYHCCSDTVTPQGIAAIVNTPNPNQIDQQSEDEDSSILQPRGGGRNPFYLVLDALSDPGNTGTLIRSGLAAGISGIILLPGCCDVWNPKSVRSAMGASFQIPIYQTRCWDDAFELLQSQLGVKTIYAATMIDGGDDDEDDEDTQGSEKTTSKSNSIPYYDIDWTIESSALIIGSEGNGLGLDVRDALLGGKYEGDNADVKMRATHIPMQPGIESLNAAVCGSIVMFEYSRQQTVVARAE